MKTILITTIYLLAITCNLNSQTLVSNKIIKTTISDTLPIFANQWVLISKMSYQSNNLVIDPENILKPKTVYSFNRRNIVIQDENGSIAESYPIKFSISGTYPNEIMFNYFSTSGNEDCYWMPLCVIDNILIVNIYSKKMKRNKFKSKYVFTQTRIFKKA